MYLCVCVCVFNNLIPSSCDVSTNVFSLPHFFLLMFISTFVCAYIHVHVCVCFKQSGGYLLK